MDSELSTLRVKSCCGCGTEQFENPEEGARPPLEAGARGLVERQQTGKAQYAIVNCRLCGLAIAPK
jgi:hypothetical protein